MARRPIPSSGPAGVTASERAREGLGLRAGPADDTVSATERRLRGLRPREGGGQRHQPSDDGSGRELKMRRSERRDFRASVLWISDVNFGGGRCRSMNTLPAWDGSDMSDERAPATSGDGEMCDVTDVARVLEVSEDQVREWIGSGIVQHTTLANGEHRVRIREESLGIPGDMERQFVLVSIGDVPPWVREPTRAVLPDLQSRDPIAKLVLHAKQDAIAPEAGIVLGLAEAGLRGGRGSAVPRIPHRPTLLVAVAAFLQDAFLDMDSGYAQARPGCPYHDHPVHPTLMNADAWWTCPRREERLHRIGEWREPQARRSRKTSTKAAIDK
jgi:hypothetical protein